MTVHPTGDPPGGLPLWFPYPANLPPSHPIPAVLLSPYTTPPAARWWALDGWALPAPFVWVFGAMGEARRQVLYGTIRRVGLYPFQQGARPVVITTRDVFLFVQEADYHQQIQTVEPEALAEAVRNFKTLPPLPGAPPVP